MTYTLDEISFFLVPSSLLLLLLLLLHIMLRIVTSRASCAVLACRLTTPHYRTTTTTTTTTTSSLGDSANDDTPQQLFETHTIPGGLYMAHKLSIDLLQSQPITRKPSYPMRQLSNEERTQIIELRKSDPTTWTLKALSDKFQCAKASISKVAPLDDDTRQQVFKATRPPRTRDIRREVVARNPHPKKF
jgi:hypothetical protein